MLFLFWARPSVLLRVGYYVLHGAAFVALAVSAVPVWLQVLLSVCLVLHLIKLLRCGLAGKGTGVVGVEADASETVIELCNRRRIPVAISELYCVPWCQIVKFHRKASSDKQPYYLVVLPDCCDTECRRRLRIWLLSVSLQHASDQVHDRF